MPQGVAKNFREIFAELAPGGRGELVMVRSHPVERQEGENAEEHAAPQERYSGVRVKVQPFTRHFVSSLLMHSSHTYLLRSLVFVG